MGNKDKGLFDKFYIERTDETHLPGQKHFGCQYFVLDLTHDKHAIPALKAYAESARLDGYELLADDILRDVETQLENAANKVCDSSSA